MARGRTEIAASACPSYIQDRFYGAAAVLREDAEREKQHFDNLLEITGGAPVETQPAPRRGESKFDRIERARRGHPQCALESCRVDTDNAFCWSGRNFRIDARAAQYAPVHTREGEYYAMDRIIVMHERGRVIGYLDGEGRALDAALIMEISP